MRHLWNFDTHADGLTYFENLLEYSSLSSSLGILEKDCAGAIRSKGELDERVFINDEDGILGSGSLSGGFVNISGVKVRFQWRMHVQMMSICVFCVEENMFNIDIYYHI